MLNKREIRECPLLLDVVEKVGGKNANALDWYAAVVAMEARNRVWGEYRKFLDARQEVAVFPSSSGFSFSTRTSVGKSSTSSQQSGRHSVGVRSRSVSAAPSDASQQSGRHSVGVRSRSGSAAPSDASQQSEAEVGVRSRSGSAAPSDASQQSEAEVGVRSRSGSAALQQMSQQSEAEVEVGDVAPLVVAQPGESAVVLADIAASEPTDDGKWERFSASLPSESDDDSSIDSAAPCSAAAALEASTASQELDAIYREFFELVKPFGSQDENAPPKKDEVKDNDPGSNGTKLSSELNAREVPNCVP
ncbi:hypothetical protein AAVH_42484 [Aphelenchoides avenae]|nr:hypothetical protein AAVH_42484 [Aphelenchus avenae]